MHVFKELEDMTSGDLNSQLKFFVFEVRKVNGERYPSSSLRDLVQGIGYYVGTIMKKNIRIFSDAEFRETVASLNAAMIENNKLKVLPSGNGPASAISPSQEDLLWERGVLGKNTPKTLVRTIFFLCGKFFGLRGGHEQRDLEWGRDIQLTQTEVGESLIYTTKYSKNYNGGLKQKNIKPKEVKAFPNPDNTDRCFVTLYKIYANKRESISNKAFYLKPMEKFSEEKWFCNSPIGHNTLSTMIKSMCEMAGLTGGNFVNHSLKKTTGTVLRKFPEHQRKAQTGNRSNAQSSYEETTDSDFIETSQGPLWNAK